MVDSKCTAHLLLGNKEQCLICLRTLLISLYPTSYTVRPIAHIRSHELRSFSETLLGVISACLEPQLQRLGASVTGCWGFADGAEFYRSDSYIYASSWC